MVIIEQVQKNNTWIVVRTGDALITTEIDRLGRTKQDTLDELRKLREKNVRVMALELPTTLMDYSSIDNEMAKMMMETINNMMIELYASMAEAEIDGYKLVEWWFCSIT